MKSAQISRLEVAGNLVNQQAESSSKTKGDFKSMLEGINSLTVNNPTAWGDPIATTATPAVTPTRSAKTVPTGSVVDAYRHDRFYPLKQRRPVSDQDFSVQPASASPRNYSYRIASKEEALKAASASAAKPTSSMTFAEAIDKVKNWFHKIFSGSQSADKGKTPIPEREKQTSQEKPRGLFAAIANFFRNFGKLLSSQSDSESGRKQKDLPGTDRVKVHGESVSNKTNDAIFAAESGQNFPDVDLRTGTGSQLPIENLVNQAAVPQEFEDSAGPLTGKANLAVVRAGRKIDADDKACTIQVRYPGSTDRIHRAILDSAKRYQLPANLVAAIIKVESDFDPRAVSPRGARGLMQLMPTTARELEVRNCFNVEQNIDGGCRYFRYLLDEFDGEVRMALAAYNAGPGAVKRYQGIPPYRETRQYLSKVLSHMYARSS